MGTYVHRGRKVRAIVRKHGHTLTKTCDNVAQAKEWIAVQESTLKKRHEFGGVTLGDVLQKHIDEVLKTKPYDVANSIMHYTMHQRRLGSTELGDINQTWWYQTVKGFNAKKRSTATRYMVEITSALRRAQEMSEGTIRLDWDGYLRAYKMLLKDKVIMARYKGRTRRPVEGEIDAIKAQLAGLDSPYADIIDFAMITGFRVGEICRLQWKDLNEVTRMIWVRARKHCIEKMDNDQHVPLLGNSLAIIQRQPRKGPLIFPVNSKTVSCAWWRACKSAGVEDLHFHDLRHEAISRMFEAGYGAPEVQLVSGHQDMKCLAIYTNLKPESLHQGPAAVRAAMAAGAIPGARIDHAKRLTRVA